MKRNFSFLKGQSLLWPCGKCTYHLPRQCWSIASKGSPWVPGAAKSMLSSPSVQSQPWLSPSHLHTHFPQNYLSICLAHLNSFLSVLPCCASQPPVLPLSPHFWLHCLCRQEPTTCFFQIDLFSVSLLCSPFFVPSTHQGKTSHIFPHHPIRLSCLLENQLNAHLHQRKERHFWGRQKFFSPLSPSSPNSDSPPWVVLRRWKCILLPTWASFWKGQLPPFVGILSSSLLLCPFQ